MSGKRDGRTQRCGAGSAVLALVLLGTAIDRASAQVIEPVAAPGQNLNPLSALDLATLGGFKGRPLFAPSRRPPPARPAVVALPPPVAAASPPPDLRLVGIVAGAEKALAILKRPAGGPSVNLKVGDTIETWRVEAIGPDRVTLREGEREKVYRLFAVGGPASPQPASRISNVPQLGGALP